MGMERLKLEHVGAKTRDWSAPLTGVNRKSVYGLSIQFGDQDLVMRLVRSVESSEIRLTSMAWPAFNNWVTVVSPSAAKAFSATAILLEAVSASRRARLISS